MGVTLDTSELRAFGTKLASSGPVVAGQATALVKSTCYLIQGSAQVAAPVDTGALMGSISTTITGDATGIIRGEVGPTVEYGIFVEEGTSVQPGQPYLGPAYDQHLPAFILGLGKLGGDAL